MAYSPHTEPTRTEIGKPPSWHLPSPWDAVRFAVARIAQGWTVRQRRHEIERMLDFEPELLADIGVSRGDVVQALTTRDPGAALARARASGTARPPQFPSN